MRKEDIESQVIVRYKRLGGLVKNDRMVNKDKESRAREYVRIQQRIAEQIKEEDQFKENSKYGKLILQTNEVQFHLIQSILLRSFNPDSKFEEYLTNSTLGPVIACLNICAQSEADVKLINDLKSYKDKRDSLAHGMLTSKKLTPKDCENAIKLGDRIIKYLIKNMKDELELKGDDLISGLPKKFNKLVKRISSLELRVKKLEDKNKKK